MAESENQDVNASHQLTFNTSLYSTPCNSNRNHTVNPTTIQTISDRTILPDNNTCTGSVLAFDTPSPLYTCGLRCRLKQDCNHES